MGEALRPAARVAPPKPVSPAQQAGYILDGSGLSAGGFDDGLFPGRERKYCCRWGDQFGQDVDKCEAFSDAFGISECIGEGWIIRTGGNRAVDHHPVGWKVSRKVGWKPDTRSLQPMVQTVPSGDLSTAASREITHEFISDLPHPPPVYAQITPNDKPGKETATVPTTLNTGKKEWRVVHINELDHPAAAGQSMTNNREYRALHIHWSNEENQPDPSPVSFSSTSSSPDNTILQIRLSPANH